MAMTLLYLIRHGETELNAARVLQPANTPLSRRGLAQAFAVAQRLAASASLSGILCSDLPRARQTASPIAAACALSIRFSSLLQERNFGDLRGQAYDSLDYDPLTSEAAPPGGESQAAFSARCRAAWSAVLQHAASLEGGNMAVVTHGLVIREWCHRRTLQVPPEIALPERWANTSVTIADAQRPYTVSLMNSTTHLDGETAEDSSSLSGG